MRRLKTLAVISVGLIGGSFALALKRRRGQDRDRRGPRLLRERARHDTAAESATDAVSADLVFVAVPVRQIASVLLTWRSPWSRRGRDRAGSTKAEVVRSPARNCVSVSRLRSGHPIAGREASGVEAAVADLYRARADAEARRRRKRSTYCGARNHAHHSGGMPGHLTSGF
jgi:prephenate dehydrogenase